MATPVNGPLPVGTVTFLLTDVEGSTTGWEAERAAMAAAIVRHYEIVDAAVRARGGARPVEQGEGDSVVAVFSLASEAVRAAVDIRHCVVPGGLVGEFFTCRPPHLTCLTSGADREKAFAVVRMAATHVPPFGRRHAGRPLSTLSVTRTRL